MKRKKRMVDCKKIEKQIPLYLENKLNPYEVQALLNHVETCKSCKEELTIQYMVSDGIKKAETENDYNLLKGLNDRIEESKEQVKTHDFLYFGFSFCLIIIACIVIAAVFTIIV